jgi:excisionase family DNA binding protein
MFNNYPDIVTVKELQEMLRVSKGTAYELVNSKIIKSLRIGRKFKIPKQAVINYLTIPAECGRIDNVHSRSVISKEDSYQ